MKTPQATRRAFVGAMAGLPALAAAPQTAAGPLAISRGELGLAPGLIHFNTASAGPTRRSVLARTIEAWQRLESDPVRMAYYPDLDTVASAADRVRSVAAALIGCTGEEILLTRGTTDGITTLAHSIGLAKGDHVLLTDQEHEGGETGWLHRRHRDGIVIDRVPIPIGDWDTSAIVRRFEAAIGPRTRAVSFSHVLSPTGLRMPVAQIAALARSKNCLCIVDGAQAVGGIDVDVKSLGCDAYATSGHKWLMGPKGTGFTYIRKESSQVISPAQWLFDRRFVSNSAGLGPIPLAVGLGEAIDRAQALGMPAIERRIIALRNTFYDGLGKFAGLRIVSPPPGPTATALVAIVLPAEVDSRAMRDRLHDRHGIIVKMAEKRWFNGLRFSPHLFNDEAQVDAALSALRSELKSFENS
jgi:selenocysteine lyase/cysteine desulfurase